MSLDFNELRQLLFAIAQTDIAELTLKSDEFELTVRKAVSVRHQSPLVEPQGLSSVGSSVSPTASAAPPSVLTPVESLPNRVVETTTTVSRAVESIANALPAIEQIVVDVPSPNGGNLLPRSSSGEPPFVETGDRIRPGQTVCIIEAMKLMNEIEAEVSGRVVEILVQDGEPVEYGQPLMRINPG